MTTPVLEVGGTHVSAALVDRSSWELVAASTRFALNPAGTADEFVATFVHAADTVGASPAVVWGVAMPDPFDYVNGIALFEGVGKFEALYGVDLRATLVSRAAARPAGVAFINDADAFTLGEWLNGAATGATRCAGITLGTGVGSGWVADGRVIDSGPDVPPGGRAHRLTVDGRPLEDVMSRRAIRRAYAEAAGTDTGIDVAEICERARGGETVAASVLAYALRTLGTTLAGPISRFGADVVVFGGSMAGSWDVLEAPFVEGFSTVAAPPRLVVAADADRAPLLGAAYGTLS
jgi:glucokinase